MTRMMLSDTLTALAEGADPGHEYLPVEEADISLPMIVRMEHGPDGPLFFAQPPWSAFRAGVEPVSHRASIRFGQVPNHNTPAHPASKAEAETATQPVMDKTG